MQITKKRLKEIIKEELQSFTEVEGASPNRDLTTDERTALDAMVKVKPEDLDVLYRMVKARMSIE